MSLPISEAASLSTVSYNFAQSSLSLQEQDAFFVEVKWQSHLEARIHV